MSSIAYYLPPPSNWADFQSLMLNIAKMKYHPDNTFEYGSQGQEQSGIDILTTDFDNNQIGIQCKQTINKITTGIIDKEIKKVISDNLPIKRYIIATTQRRDTKLQSYIININTKNLYPFNIEILFWDDINVLLNTSDQIITQFYSEFAKNFGVNDMKNHLEMLSKAFDRPAFIDDFMYELNYQDFGKALSNTMAFLKTGYLYDNYQNNIISHMIPSYKIPDKNYKEFLFNLENKICQLYKRFIKDTDKNNLTKNSNNYDFRFYNLKREEILNHINKRLRENNLSPIKYSFQFTHN